MLASSERDKTERMKQQSKAYNEGKLKESNIFKSNNEILSHRVETICIEKNSKTANLW